MAEPNRPGDGFKFTTKLWGRGQNSHATTVPQNILAIKGVPVEEEVQVEWRINQDTGAVEVEFNQVTEDGE